ncbi:MAG: decaprenyl-phosphate phosphoribosyltransferase [Candidatus Sericytochromatia bacterium]|nr:decaprenyl-phosphate phosphoribosyltransferase [Candidatus Sericytochromatia bacterium]
MARVPQAVAGWQALLALLRPRQWIKNGFVLAPLIFTGLFVRPDALGQAGLAAFLFCLASSAVYVFNDRVDVERDRRHPLKRLSRPLAAGTVSVRSADGLLGVLLLPVLLALWLWPQVGALIGAYLGLNVAYSLRLKHVPVVDIFCVATGFLLRVAAGAAALSVPLSNWMLVTTLCLALYLAAVKRRQELALTDGGARGVLGAYTVSLLDRYAQMAATAAILFYALFTSTVRPQLALTVVLVLFGFFRYSYLVEARQAGENPTEVVWQDAPLLLTLALWVAGCSWVMWLG